MVLESDGGSSFFSKTLRRREREGGIFFIFSKSDKPGAVFFLSG